MGVRVASASETVACERAVIEAGTSSYDLMRRAGEAAASLIAAEYGETSHGGVAIYAGPGNNGGDAWVVAGALSRRAIKCRVRAVGEPRTAEARRAKADALDAGLDPEPQPAGSESIIVDGLLGTGSKGSPRGEIAEALGSIELRRNSAIAVVALDLPSGLDATTGAHTTTARADLTVTFGMMKRGHLIARDLCGRIVVVDIGLDSPERECLPVLVDDEWVRERVPQIAASAHKGTRKSLTVIGGGKDMAGAAILAGEGALRAGIGIVRIAVAAGNEVAIHAGLPAAIVKAWPATTDDLATLVRTADAIAIGPGLGHSAATRDLVERVLLASNAPVVVDADAINVFEGDALSLSQLLRGRPAIITPHPAEFARLAGVTTAEVVRERFDIGIELASQLGAAILLKGSPTIVFAPSGERFVSASGTAALATGGSGDVLTGVAGTLAAQMCTGDDPRSPAEAAACAAFVHGRAAGLCGTVRGTTLSDILAMFPEAWKLRDTPHEPGILAKLESVS